MTTALLVGIRGAIAALLSQRNLEEATRIAGIAAKTFFRWLQILQWKKACRQLRGAVVGLVTAGCRGGGLHTIENHSESRCAGPQPAVGCSICSGTSTEGIRTGRCGNSHRPTGEAEQDGNETE